MSIYIKGMEMPTSCGDCPIGDSLCCSLMPGVPALWKEYTIAIRTNKRHSHCPLIPVPPHGDLIDRKELYKKTADWEAQALHMVEVAAHEDTTEWRKWSTVLTERSAFKYDVADAPTVIPADKEAE